MPTQTITLQYGPIGGLTSSTFSWTVTNVSATGSFVDGTPWIVVGAGAQLIDVSPKSELKTSTFVGAGGSTLGVGITFYINGSAKNLKARYYTDPNFNFTPYTRGTTGNGKFPLDGRYQPTGDIGVIGDTNEEIQASYNSFYDGASNIGITGIDGSITPVALTGGDVIVTANSIFHRGPELESQEFNNLFTSSDLELSASIPNAPFRWRTGIKELGVLTVLSQAPSQPCFRPPMQWISGSEHTRPNPIPVSAVTGDSPLFHNTTVATNLKDYLNNDYLLRSPIFHEGHDVKNQSSSGNFSWYAGSSPSAMQSNWTYLSSNGIRALNNSVFMAFNKKYENINVPGMPTFGGTVAQNSRTVARNRLIQYGIDCYGAFMSMADIYGTGGHRGGEAKGWILLAGYLTRNSSMLNMLNSFRTQYAGTTYASLTDDQILERKFADDAVVFQIGATMDCGSWIRQTFAPDSQYKVQTVDPLPLSSTTVYNTTEQISGKFARFTVNACNLYPSEVSCTHCRKGVNYFGAYVQVTSGPGSGNTTYRIIRVYPTGSPPTEFILDRPWIYGTPDSTSTIKIFSVRDGVSNPGGVTTDIGRYIYQPYGIERIGDDLNYFRSANLSYMSDNYAAQFLGTLANHLLFKPLFERGEFLTPGVTGVNSGLTAFFIGKTWKYLSEYVVGSNKSIVSQILGSDETISNCPNGENLSNLVWFNYVVGSFTNYNNTVFPVWRNWLSMINENDPNSPFGYQSRNRLPGNGLTAYDATILSRVLGNFGRTGGGGSDFNGDSITDSQDLTFILDKWGTQ